MANESTVMIGFQINAIQVSSFSVNESLIHEGEEIDFRINLQHLFNPEYSEQIIQVELEATHTSAKSPLVILHVSCHYQLTGYQEWIQSQPAATHVPGKLPDGLAVTLNSISLSTTRGVLFERLRGTSLQNVVLPIIDPSAFHSVN